MTVTGDFSPAVQMYVFARKRQAFEKTERRG
jgi:hypothetical protein